MQKRNLLVASIAAMIVMTLVPVPPVLSYEKKEVLLGSSVDPTTFIYRDHTIAEGFAADISMDLPVPTKTATQTKVGFAVAGLGDPWIEEEEPWLKDEYTPYVKEMWLKVEGGSGYTVYTGSIFDNTGTGPPSMEFLEIILLGLDIAFDAYEIYKLLKEIYQEPPVEEWQHDGHWAKAIVQQKTEPWPWPPGTYKVEGPRLQTAGANVLSYFDADGPQTLAITAGAEIYVQLWDKITNEVVHDHIGTYSVSFQVSVPVGVYDLSVRTYLTNGEPIYDVNVWIDDELAGYSWVTTEVGYGTHTVKVEPYFYRDNHKYVFQYWEDGSTSNPKTVNVVSDVTLRAYYVLPPGDANGDGHVNVIDLGMLGVHWGPAGNPYDPRCDFNGDGTINVLDLGILGANWLRWSEVASEGGGTTKVYVDPQTSTAAVGDTFTVNITVCDVENFYGWSAGMNFNASVLRCLGFEEGPFLKQGGATISVSGTIDNENGTISPYGYSSTGTGGVNGTGVLASITFEVIGLGDSYLNLTDVDLIKIVGGEIECIPFEAINGHFEKWHDIAITNVTFSYDTKVVYPTWIGPPKINVTVKNEGVSSETFNVTAYYENATGTYTIGTQTVTNLAPGANTTLTFTWNVPPLPGYPNNKTAAWPYPVYTIFANASVVPYEVDTSDNSYVYGTVKVQWPGDANGDGHVNVIDQGLLGNAWLSKYGDPKYDPRVDFNGDGKVNILDLGILAANWLKGPLD